MSWVHRFAHDFIFDQGNRQTSELLDTCSLREVASLLLEGHMKLLCAAPCSLSDGAMRHSSSIDAVERYFAPSFDHRIDLLVNLANRGRVTAGCEIDSLLEDLRKTVEHFYLVTDLQYPDVGLYSNPSSHSIPMYDSEYNLLNEMRRLPAVRDFRRGLIWREIIAIDALDCVTAHLLDFMACNDCGTTAAWLICDICHSWDFVNVQKWHILSSLIATLRVLIPPCSIISTGSPSSLIARRIMFTSVGRKRVSRLGSDVKYREHEVIEWVPLTFEVSADDPLSHLMLCEAIEAVVAAPLELLSWAPAAQRQDTVDHEAPGVHSALETYQLYSDIVDILNSFQVFIGIRSWNIWPFQHRRLSLQATPSIVAWQVQNESLFGRKGPGLPFRSKRVVIFRLVCTRRGDEDPVCVHNISSQLTPRLLEFVMCGLDCVLENNELKAALIQEVWDAPATQMTAWQQLSMSACIKTCERPQFALYKHSPQSGACRHYKLPEAGWQSRR